ncbi:MAG: 3-deoxy-manno-octulosonate cytidylyltransferase [Pseudohongiella sp.]|jgi:3-deoxy-manno-octulosonate cytidylyltransferase (CMP-KDO synthetase)|nr:3-deoxy-manno-octulosonate cytidylyltransferase [Pseudohongiella sp.]
MSFSVVIPARYAATRLPAKVLLDIGGKPMLQHTYERAMASNAEQVFIATDDERIKQVAEQFGARVCMTSAAHRSGTDRIQEVATQIGMSEEKLLVNVQADEPLIPPEVINQVAENLQANGQAGIATLCDTISVQQEIDDPNCVKVVMDSRGHALYFSRATIPWQASASCRNSYRHIGIYAYRVSILNQFVQWPQSELEIQEKLEQLRALYHGVVIHVAVASVSIPPGVDTEQDLQMVRAHLAAQ